MTTLIRMPRFGGPGGSGHRRGARRSLVSRAWYSGCMVLGSGCLYTAPVVQMNRPPEILQPDIERGEEYLVPLATVTVLKVIATDEDSDELYCYWIEDTEEPQIELCNREKELVYSTYQLAFDPELDGALVEAHIFDPESEEDVRIDFRLVIDGGEL
jgi:hypothetical protein